jgi:pectinesterase
VFFGRPWGDYARVVFKDTDVQVEMNPRMWNPWHPGDERTDHSTRAFCGRGRAC